VISYSEGMPRSGKSLDAMKGHIVPALQQGRIVQVYIAGLDFKKIAEVAGLSFERVCQLLESIEADQVKNITDWAKDNALIVIDEVQNFWPNGREKLTDAMTLLITEHGHRGIDFLLMGQDLKDIHALWRRRVNKKMYFMKLDAIGKQKRYKWISYTATASEKFTQIASDTAEYDESYFGTYKSHVGEHVNTGVYTDKRALLWSSRSFVWLKRFGVVLLLAIGYLVYLFAGGGLGKSMGVKKQEPVYVPPAPTVSMPGGNALQHDRPQSSVSAPSAVSAINDVPPDYIQDISKRWRPRLSAWATKRDGSVFILVEWFDTSFRRMESLKADDIHQYGYSVKLKGEVAELKREDGKGQALLVSSWPIDPFGHVSGEQTRAISAGPNTDLREGQGSIQSDDAVGITLPAPPRLAFAQKK
jgi:zona occludens toxin